jgi:hypothetical protein
MCSPAGLGAETIYVKYTPTRYKLLRLQKNPFFLKQTTLQGSRGGRAQEALSVNHDGCHATIRDFSLSGSGGTSYGVCTIARPSHELERQVRIFFQVSYQTFEYYYVLNDDAGHGSGDSFQKIYNGKNLRHLSTCCDCSACLREIRCRVRITLLAEPRRR